MAKPDFPGDRDRVKAFFEDQGLLGAVERSGDTLERNSRTR